MRLVPTPREPDRLDPSQVDELCVRLRIAGERLPIRLLYLHGSHAAGTQGALSDLDLAVLLEPAAAGDLDAVLEIQARLADVCQRDDVDLVVLDTAGPLIRDAVARRGRLVYARGPADRIRFETRAIKEAADFRHFSRRYDDALLRQLRTGKFLG